MDEKFDLYLKIMINRYRVVVYKKRLVEEIISKAKTKEIDLLFLRYVANSFFKEMILNMAHLYENNSSGNENVTLRRLLDRHLDSLKEKPKKNKDRMRICEELFKTTKKYRYNNLTQVFEYRNGLLAHSDFKLFQKLISKEKKFNNLIGEVTLGLEHAHKVLMFLVPSFELDTSELETALEDLNHTFMLIEQHQEFIHAMLEAEKNQGGYVW